MRLLRHRPNQFAIAVAAILLLLLLLAGCVISPRRVVAENPSPTPTPTISPTPTPGATPSATPTPTPMAATVSPQFLFVGEADAPVVTAFRINSDGSLAPVPGSPFAIKAPAQALAAAHDILLVTTETGITAFHVEKETGFLQQTDLAGISMTARDTPSVAGTGPQLAVLDSGERFMFVVNANQAELLQYRVERGKPLSPPIAAIPIPHSATSITVVKP